MKRWLILYDISNHKRLAKVARILEGFGQRVQKSVFEAEASSRAVNEVKLKIERVIDAEKDYVLFFALCQDDWEKREKFGFGSEELPAARAYEII